MGEALITRRGGGSGGSGKKIIQGTVSAGGNNGITITFPLADVPNSLGYYFANVQWRSNDGSERVMGFVLLVEDWTYITVPGYSNQQAVVIIGRSPAWQSAVGSTQAAQVSVSRSSNAVSCTWNYIGVGVVAGTAEMWRIEPLS